MSTINWSLNECIELSGERYRIHSRRSDKKLNILHERDNRFVTMTDDELVAKWEEGELERLQDPDENLPEGVREMLKRPFNELPDATREAAMWRYPYIKGYVDRKIRSRSDSVLNKLIADVAQETGGDLLPSARQLRRWLADWYAIGAPDLQDIRCIAPRFHLRGNSKSRFDPDVEEIFIDVIEDEWLKPNRASGEEIHKLATGLAQQLPTEGRDERFLDAKGRLRVPSVRTVYRMLAAIAQDIVIKGQRGAIEADRLCEPVIRGPQAQWPLEEVEIDHTLLDVIVIDTTRRIALGRPWITVALDRYTRMVLGVYIGFKPPGAQTVMLCLRNAIRFKQPLLDDCERLGFPISHSWPCHGKPKAIVVDNGPEFHSRAFKEACAALNIDIIYCPVRKPRYKGKVERWFGRLQKQLIHRIPGTTFSNIKQRGDYEAEKKAVMTLTDIRACVIRWIVDDYSVSVHRGINCAPLSRWNRCIEAKPVSMPARIDDLDVLLSHFEMRKLTRRGIELYGLLFNERTDEMRQFINRPDKPAVVKVRVNVEDLESVEVEDWRTGRFVKVKCTDPDYAKGMSLQEHVIVSQRAKAELKKYQRLNMDHLIRAKQQFRDKIRDIEKAGKLTSKRLLVAIGAEDEYLGMVPVESMAAEVDEPVAVQPAVELRTKQEPKPVKGMAQKSKVAASIVEDEDDDLNALLERTADFGVSARTFA